MSKALLFLMIAGMLFPDCSAAESDSKVKPGLRQIQLVTDISAVTPGEKFTVALVIDPLPGYHTYWRGPGIAGVATSFNWTLPPGFTAGEVFWPPPQKVDMVGITAYGYPSRTMLLTEIQAPENIKNGETILSVQCAWMACSKSCNPGVEDFSITLPVNRTDTPSAKDLSLSAEFEKFRQSVPLPAPDSWTITPRFTSPNQIDLLLSIPGLSAAAASTVYFFCYDMQVDSDAAQQITFPEVAGKKQFQITLLQPDVTPESPTTLSGVLYCPAGWPGLESAYVEISVPWSAGPLKK